MRYQKISQIFVFVGCVGSFIQAVNFLPERSVDSLLTSAGHRQDGLSVDFAVEYAATLKSSAVGGFYGPWEQHSFGISNSNPQTDLYLSNF